MVLSIQDYADINSHVVFHRTRLEERQLRLSASDDMTAFVEARETLPGYIHPAFDPTKSTILPGSAFWVSVHGRDGDMIACAATRCFDSARLLDLFMSRQVWYTAGTVIDDMAPLLIDWPEHARNVEGRLAIHGSLVVRQDHKRFGIGTHLIRLVRAASLRRWRQDWNFGLVRAELKATSFQHRRYGYPFTCTAFEEPPSWGPKHDVEYLNLISQTEMLAEYRNDPSNLGL